MALLSIKKIGDPVLRAQCKPVNQVNPEDIKLLDDLIETLNATPNSVGLAAPQVGVAKRIAVLDCGGGLIELIDPILIEKSGEKFDYESCLSLPKVVGKLKRAKYVKVKTLKRNGQEAIIEAKGFVARCLQHEIDHLAGVLYIDHVNQGYLYDENSNARLDVFEMIKLSNAR